ncbi:hypothetical protein PROFUN_13161 [Planoprotostelium fungivorum]|uniref:Uncharacterized protein n=1 Tax=Planoprotostelium fungivorum TaxID=1890364 RepID=A0A2P6N563_9EUKA|nr:hypothetical protein PROFUN_13161 [Planoprotostelium fungivorum]
MRGIDILAALSLTLVCIASASWGDCTYGDYDLTALKQATDIITSDQGNLQAPGACPADCSACSSYQMSNGMNQVACLINNASVSFSPLPPTNPTTGTAGPQEAGLLITSLQIPQYLNQGEQPKALNAYIYVYCNETYKTPQLLTNGWTGAGFQLFNLTTAAGCKRVPQSPDGGGGIGAGWVICILVFVTVVLYWAVGGIAIRVRTGAFGVPNQNVWKETGSLITDGVKFSMSKVTGKREEYQSISDSLLQWRKCPTKFPGESRQEKMRGADLLAALSLSLVCIVSAGWGDCTYGDYDLTALKLATDITLREQSNLQAPGACPADCSVCSSLATHGMTEVACMIKNSSVSFSACELMHYLFVTDAILQCHRQILLLGLLDHKKVMKAFVVHLTSSLMATAGLLITSLQTPKNINPGDRPQSANVYIYVYCNETYTVPVLLANGWTGAGFQLFNLTTAAGCKRVPQSPDGGGGIGAGWVICIVVLVAVVLYWAVGGIAIRVRTGAFGVPNQNMWKETGSLLTDGVKFSMSKVTGKRAEYQSV